MIEPIWREKNGLHYDEEAIVEMFSNLFSECEDMCDIAGTYYILSTALNKAQGEKCKSFS